MRLKLKILGSIIIFTTLSCYIPGKEAPTFENCPSFPKSWNFLEFGYAGVLNFFVLDEKHQPIVIKVYPENDKQYLELSWFKGDERKKLKTELARRAKYLWASYGHGLVHTSISEDKEESPHITYCLSDLTEWVCEGIEHEGEPRVLIAHDSSVAMLVASKTELKYLLKYGNEWQNRGAVEFSGPAQSWTFSVFRDRLIVAIADNKCTLRLLEFDNSWDQKNTGQKLCALSLTSINVFGFPFVIGKKSVEGSDKGIVFLDVLNEWVEFELGDQIEDLSAVYPDGCNEAFAVYRREDTLNRCSIEFEPYSLKVGAEREIELPADYKLLKIVGAVLDTDRNLHMLLEVKKGNKNILLYAGPK